MELVADPQLEAALEDDHDLVVGLMGVRLVTGPATRFESRQDDLETAVTAGGQELVDRVQAAVDDPSPIGPSDDSAKRGLIDEQLGDPEVEGSGDPLDRGDRRAGDLALDLGEEALGHAGSFGKLAEGHLTGLAERPDPRPELELRGSHRLATSDCLRRGTRAAEV